MAKETPTVNKINYICDFSRCGLNTRFYTLVFKPCSEATNIVYFIYCGLCFGWRQKDKVYCWRICGFVRWLSLAIGGKSEFILGEI